MTDRRPPNKPKKLLRDDPKPISDEDALEMLFQWDMAVNAHHVYCSTFAPRHSRGPCKTCPQWALDDIERILPFLPMLLRIEELSPAFVAYRGTDE